MGFFDYICQNDKCLNWQGGQNDHDDDDFVVYIRVPLKNYKMCFLKGIYDGYGHVEVEDLVFKDIQFEESYNRRTIADDSQYFCDKIWCEDCFTMKFFAKNEPPSKDLLYTEAEFLGDNPSIGIAHLLFEIQSITNDLIVLNDNKHREGLENLINQKKKLLKDMYDEIETK